MKMKICNELIHYLLLQTIKNQAKQASNIFFKLSPDNISIHIMIGCHYFKINKYKISKLVNNKANNKTQKNISYLELSTNEQFHNIIKHLSFPKLRLLKYDKSNFPLTANIIKRIPT